MAPATLGTTSTVPSRAPRVDHVLEPGGHATGAAFGEPLVTAHAYPAPGGVATVAVVSVPVIVTGVAVAVGAVATVSAFGDAHVTVSHPAFIDLPAGAAAPVALAASYAADLALAAADAEAIRVDAYWPVPLDGDAADTALLDIGAAFGPVPLP